MPISEKQLAANRANATRSTGPRTPEGKTRSALNARKHGFAAATFSAVRLEDRGELENLRSDLISLYQPQNSQELFAIDRMALAQQMILRAARLEAGLFTAALDSVISSAAPRLMDPMLVGDGDIEITKAQNRNFLLGEGFHYMAHHGKSWNLFLRYQAQAERLYRRALEEFQRARAETPDLPEPLEEPAPDAQASPEPDSNSESDLPNEPISTRNPADLQRLPDTETNPPNALPILEVLRPETCIPDPDTAYNKPGITGPDVPIGR